MAILLTLPYSLSLPTPFKVTISIVLLLAMVSGSIAEPDFASAKTLINNLKPNLRYDELCVGKLMEGQIKSACRIAKVPSVVFLVCHSFNQGICSFHIGTEVGNIQKLSAGGVSTVKIDKEVITGVKCAKTTELTCDGFLEEWIDGTVGWWHRLNNNFKYGTVKTLIEQVRQKITTPEGRKKTASDLKNILAFVVAPQGQYHLICDLQGFFLYSGGFLVADPEDVKEQVGLQQSCDPMREPTTQQVMAGLNQLIQDLSRG